MEKAPELAWPNSGDGSAATNANEKESQPTSSRVSAGELPAAAGNEGKVEGKKPPQPVRSSGGVLKSRPLLRAVKNTFRDLVPGLGGHNSFGVTAAELGSGVGVTAAPAEARPVAGGGDVGSPPGPAPSSPLSDTTWVKEFVGLCEWSEQESERTREVRTRSSSRVWGRVRGG